MSGATANGVALTRRAIRFRLNGREVSVQGEPAHTTLLDYLRGVGFTGSKEGCAEGECGACTVLLVAPEGERQSAYRTANSCLMLLPMVDGHEVFTVESLAEGGTLCEAQEAMAAGGGSQCGYCTPGFVMSLFAEQYRPGRSGECDVDAMSGNLCRCTGYRPIRDAALTLGPPPEGAFLQRLRSAAPQLTAFSYETAECRFSRPTTVEQCVALLAADPASRVIAGGTDVAVESNLRGSRFAHLVSLDAIAELQQFSIGVAEVTIGAALPLGELMRQWPAMPAALRECLEAFASTTIRNRATLGGNLASASPIGDTAPVLLAMDAAVEIAGPAGRRRAPLHSFFTDYRKTVLLPGEIVTAVHVPLPLPGDLAFYKVSKRRVDDISTVSAAMALGRNAAGETLMARFAFGGVAATPLLVEDCAREAIGRPFNLDTVRRVQDVLARQLKPLNDHRGSAAYRQAVAQSLVEKFWWQLEQNRHG